MRTWIKMITLIVWVFLISYLSSVYEVPKNIYYLIIVGPLMFGGAFLIDYLFDRKGKSDKKVS